MDEQWSTEKIHGYIRLALPLMSKYDIPITPENYSIWYKYVSGADSELSKRIDTLLRNGASFSSKTNEELYRQFCSGAGEYELKKIRQDLNLVLTTVLKQVMDLSGQTEEYESFVSDSANLLSESTSPEDIQKILGEIIEKTRTLGNFGKKLQSELKETTQTLDILKKDFEQIRTEAFVDFLTGVANRKAFDDTLHTILGETVAEARKVSLLIIDIDHFKKFNDTYGHLIGDSVLKFVAKKIMGKVREQDFVARFGGEEFAVLLPRTSLNDAEAMAEGIRNVLSQAPLRASSSSKNLGYLTVSIGVACHHPGEPMDQFVSRCDRALYSAKKTGRNRVVSERTAASD